ncbi:MutS family DNA mismatch repair protein [Novipirellula artificiosorum]|uniref:DNA mismatch repair protein MutS n=1 Tax=Novipirellula artificiosorum TaxID=2528016 RepID=A0A5C6E5K4_9BACT|nr:MutS family DNA mismatch repair protein [Novipirellula artificiosorum]TWU42881.1 DNA mismatch repair protein MutS [Novipirellula artificiosorum]
MTDSTAISGTNVGNGDDALDRYRTQLQQIEAARSLLKIRDRKFGTARVVLFLLAIVFLFLGTHFGGMPSAWPIGWIALAGFLTTVILNEPVRDQLESLRRERSVVRRLIARIERDWQRLATATLSRQLSEIELPTAQHDVATDLDLLGKASLFHLVSMTATTPGIRTLASWLTGPAIAAEAIPRTRAIETLAPLREERIRFYMLSRKVAESSGDPDRFASWAGGERWLESRRWLSIWANVSAILAGVFFVGVLASVLGISAAGNPKLHLAGLIGLGFINLLMTSIMLGPAHSIFSIAMASRSAVADYAELFDAAHELPVDDANGEMSKLGQIRDTLLTGERSAAEGMRSLQKVASAGSLRQSAATFLVYLPLQAFALWDVRVLHRLEQWQQQYGDVVSNWFEALGQFESLVSLAALRDEYPQWTFPQWKTTSDGGGTLAAVSIGHPLLNDTDRVTNDVSVGPSGTLLLVTGSNMSGKSTMLRSIGLNVALAATGAPVCASEFALPSMELATSIRVSDNLSEGVSFYMAELHRLKQVVDHARRLAQQDDRVLLFLLDEILQGTNSRERQIAVVQVLRHLINLQSIGAISTHDLELADEPDLHSMAHTVHFRETITKGDDGHDTMTFDYKMREGVSPTTNALRLLEMVGL